MRTTKGILPFLVLILFFSCRKDGADKRIYGRWKMTGYYLDGVSAPDTIAKYFQGYEYEIKPMKDYPYNSCECNASMRIYDAGTAVTDPTDSRIGPETITTYALKTFRMHPKGCYFNSASVDCWSFPSRWNYSISGGDMEWILFGDITTSHTHRIIFSKI